jgi:hypothetical protein
MILNQRNTAGAGYGSFVKQLVVIQKISLPRTWHNSSFTNVQLDIMMIIATT